MDRTYKRYLPYLIFITTILVGTVTIVIATQMDKIKENEKNDKEANEQVSQDFAEGVFYSNTDKITCEGEINGNTYTLTLVGSVTEDPETPNILHPGDNTYNYDTYTTKYDIKIAKFQKNGENVYSADCVDSDGNILTVDGEQIGVGKSCETLLEEGVEIPQDAKTRNNGVELLWSDYRNFCDGSSNLQDNNQYYTGQKCANSEYSFCCQNTNTPNYKQDHEKQFLELNNDSTISGEISTNFGHNDAVNNACGTIQHNVVIDAFKPSDQEEFIQCSNDSNQSVLITRSSQSGYACSVDEKLLPVCTTLNYSPESDNKNEDGTYPTSSEWTFICDGEPQAENAQITGYEFVFVDNESGEIVDTVQCVDNNEKPTSEQARSCLYQDSSATLVGYKFPKEGKFVAKCKVRDSNGAWSLID